MDDDPDPLVELIGHTIIWALVIYIALMAATILKPMAAESEAPPVSVHELQ